MANQTGRKREISLADLSKKFLAQLAAENAPPPDGAFNVDDARESPSLAGKSTKRMLEMLANDTRLESKLYRGRRWFWPKTKGTK